MKLYYFHAGRLKIFVILLEKRRYGATSIIAYWLQEHLKKSTTKVDA